MLNPDMFRSRADEVVKKFFNRMQRSAMAISAHDEYHVAARGTGKSEGIDARFILQMVWEMPGSTGALLSPTYSKAWNNTLPAICHSLKCWGYIEGVHFVVGHKAPSSMNFAVSEYKYTRIFKQFTTASPTRSCCSSGWRIEPGSHGRLY